MPDGIGRAYIASFTLVTLVTLVLALRARPPLTLFTRTYLRWLARPWKVATLAVAFTGMVIVAPLSGDPTWDYATGGVQSALTFLTAPWSVGTIYRTIRRVEVRALALWVAVIAWMVAVSWFYDAYLYARDGRYGPLWLENLMASSGLYVLAGSLWSLRPSAPGERNILGATLAFHSRDWPARPEGSHRRIAAVAFAIMLFTTVLMSPFLFHAWSMARLP